MHEKGFIMRKHGGYLVFIISAIILITASNLSAKTRGIHVSVKTSKGRNIELYSDSYALIIGNGSYTNGWDSLPGAVRDVKEVAEALERNGFKVKLKTDLNKNGFDREFAEFVLKHGKEKNNRLLFYYAGHGYTKKLATDEDLGYLVMVDAPVPEKFPIGFSLKSVDMQSLVTQAKMIQSKHVLFIFDSCFSGTVLNLRDRVTPDIISDNIRNPVRQFITAGRANESVPDYSVFKQCFLDILEGRDVEPIPDGYLTGEELGLYLKTKVPTYNSNQHPQYGKIRDPKLDKGDFIFTLKSPSIPSSPTPATPSLPPDAEDIGDYETVIQQRRATKNKWAQWQTRMEKNFKKGESYDKNLELNSNEKAGIWTKFLSHYYVNNPYSINDEKLRKKALERQMYWKKLQGATSKKLPIKPESKKKTIAYIPKNSIRPVVTLRSKGKHIYVRKSMLQKYNLFDSAFNKNGDFNNDFVDTGNGTIIDRATGLMWQKGSSKKKVWVKSNEARTYETNKCIKQLNNQKLAGYSDWRLPTAEELASLIEPQKTNGNLHIDPVFLKISKCISSDIMSGSVHHFFNNSVYIDYSRGRILSVEWGSEERVSVKAVRSIK